MIKLVVILQIIDIRHVRVMRRYVLMLGRGQIIIQNFNDVQNIHVSLARARQPVIMNIVVLPVFMVPVQMVRRVVRNVHRLMRI